MRLNIRQCTWAEGGAHGLNSWPGPLCKLVGLITTQKNKSMQVHKAQHKLSQMFTMNLRTTDIISCPETHPIASKVHHHCM